MRDSYKSDIPILIGTLAVVIGTLRGERDGLAYLLPLCFIGFGVALRLASTWKANRLLDEVLGNPQAIRFYQLTLGTWSSGELGPSYQREASKPFADFVRTYRPAKGGALRELLYNRFPPQPDEFLVVASDFSGTRWRDWYVITNLRIILKDGASKNYNEVRLSDVESFQISGVRKKTVTFHLKSGAAVEFNGVLQPPPETILIRLSGLKARQ